MNRLIHWMGAIVLILSPAAVVAQVAVAPQIKNASGANIPSQGALLIDSTGTAISSTNPLTTGGKQESFQLIAANTPSAAARVFGGDYILSQGCSAYGTFSLQVLGPDGSTWQTIITKTASDTAGGTGFALGSYAQIRVTVTGTTACNAIVARVPA